MAEASDPVLEWLQRFYLSNCDGEWEHQFGITIATLDNPGWSVDVDLKDGLENKYFEPLQIERSETNWVHCRIEGNKFRAFGGPNNLTELLVLFRDWAGNN
jgi:hypothetical protein